MSTQWNSPPPQLELAGLMTADPLTLMAHVDEEGLPPGFRWPQFLADLHDVTDAVLYRDARLLDVERLAVCRDLLIAIAGYFGGRTVYLPTGETLALALRDRQLWARHLHGASPQTLMSETGLSEPRFYAILRQQRALFERRIQGRLFDDREGG